MIVMKKFLTGTLMTVLVASGSFCFAAGIPDGETIPVTKADEVMPSTASIGEGDTIFGPSVAGFRYAMNLEGKFAYIDEEGNLLTDFLFDGCFDFSETGYGLAFTLDESGNREAYYSVDSEGTVEKFDPALGNVDYFDGEFGIVSIFPEESGVAAEYSIKSALIDGQKKLITDYDNQGIYNMNGMIQILKDGKVGVLDKQGNLVIPIEYEEISNTYTDVNDYKSQKVVTDNVWSVRKEVEPMVYRYGYIRPRGEILIPCEYESAEGFQNGYGILGQNDKYAVIDTHGNFITGFDYDMVIPFIEGLAIVKIGENMGCIDTKGEMIVPCIYQEIGTRIENGQIPVYTWDDDVSSGVPRMIPNPIAAQRDINIYLENNWLYTDQEPIIKDGRTLAPIRAISEALGYTVSWNSETQTVTLQNEEQILWMEIGSNLVSRNFFDDGIAPEEIVLDVPAQIVGGRTLVPVRFLAENIGADVDWNPETKRIDIQR